MPGIDLSNAKHLRSVGRLLISYELIGHQRRQSAAANAGAITDGGVTEVGAVIGVLLAVGAGICVFLVAWWIVGKL
jgi:hypothetical protein